MHWQFIFEPISLATVTIFTAHLQRVVHVVIITAHLELPAWHKDHHHPVGGTGPDVVPERTCGR
jgi:hypothetical protein